MSQLRAEPGTIPTEVTCPHCGMKLYAWCDVDRYDSNRPVLVVCSEGQGGCERIFAALLFLETRARVFTLEPVGE